MRPDCEQADQLQPTASRIFGAGALAGQVALVTGGGTGLGRATARELAACGAEVVIAGRREEVLASAAEEIGARCTIVSGDIREPGEPERIVAQALERHGRLDVLVSNAGGQYFAPAEAIGWKGWNAVMRLNAGATLAMAQAAHEQAMRARGGTILNVTLSPHHGMPGMAHSGAARAAVEELTRELATEWASDGVTVVALAAGHFETEVLSKYPKEVYRSVARTPPLQRLGRPEEHAWLVAFLCMPAGRAFSGSVVTLDGARDNWFGPWPSEGLKDERGEVPIEQRPAPPPA